MAVIRWAGFAGENRALQPMQLPDDVGVVNLNCKPGRGDARPWRQPLTVAAVPAGRQTIYRMGRDVDSDSQYWLSWPTVVHAMRGSDKGTTTSPGTSASAGGKRARWRLSGRCCGFWPSRMCWPASKRQA